MFPPIPSFDGLHPIVVHFPVALLMVAPLFLALAAIFPSKAGCFGRAALLLLALGTIASFVAVESGEAAARLADRTPEINAQIERHQGLADTTRNVFAGLTVAYAAVLLWPMLRRKEWGAGALRLVNAVALIAALGGALLVANTGHAGGVLVHGLGVQAMIDAGPAPAP